MASLPRVPMEAGCKHDRTLLAKQAEIIADNGAYMNYAPEILLSATTRRDNLYWLKNVQTDSYFVYTNNKVTTSDRVGSCILLDTDFLLQGLGLSAIGQRVRGVR